MKTILISAGHNDEDPGAVGNGYKEAVLAVKMRDRVADILRGRGLTVLEDGADGENERLNSAIALAKKADVAVEIHFNAGPAAATGIEALAKPKLSKLSAALCGAISKVTGLKVRGPDGGWKSDDSGQHHRLGFCEAGGIVLEVCFISNAGDMKAYVDNKLAVATAVAEEILAYALV